MKTLFIFLVLLFTFGLFTSCGSDGSDGRAYISHSWDWYVDWYEDSNYDTPSTIYQYTDYETSPGSFSYEYGCSDGLGNYWGYYGTYTITINQGEDGGFLTSGDDGADNYFRMDLSGGGTDFYLLKDNVPEKEIKNELSGNTNKSEVRVDDGNLEIITLHGKTATMVITKQRYIVQ